MRQLGCATNDYEKDCNDLRISNKQKLPKPLKTTAQEGNKFKVLMCNTMMLKNSAKKNITVYKGA